MDAAPPPPLCRLRPRQLMMSISTGESAEAPARPLSQPQLAEVFCLQHPGKSYMSTLFMSLPPSYYFMLSWFLSSPVFFICFYIRSHENGLSGNYGNHRIRNCGGIAQTCLRQHTFVKRVEPVFLSPWLLLCVCVCALYIFFCFFDFQCESLSSLDHTAGTCAGGCSSYLAMYFLQIHNGPTHRSVCLSMTPVFSVYCGDGTQPECTYRCLCMDLCFLEIALI